MNKILLIGGVTTLCVGIAGAFYFFHSPTELPIAPPAPMPVLDVAALQAKAEQGDVPAQARLGRAFAKGEGVTQDYKQAAKWLGPAASNGNVEAEAMLGELYQAGQGVKHNLTNAVKWMTLAAEGGSTAAQYNLGYMYERGLGVKHDEKQAAHWEQLAAEGGDALAQFDYGQRVYAGMGLAADPVEGLKWLLVAAAQGQTDAKEKAETFKKSLSRDQIAEAKSKAAAFVPRSAKN